MSPEAVLLALRLALAVVLYAFLGATLLYLRRDSAGAATEQISAPPSHLTLLTDPDPGSSFVLAPLNLLGRAADNTIRLDETTVSSHHARLSFQGGQWWLEDLGSKNGTGVNDMELLEPMVVTYGDRLRLGTVTLELKSGPPTIEVDAELAATERPPQGDG